LKYVAIVQNVVVDEKAGGFDLLLSFIGFDQGFAIECLKILEFVDRKISERQVCAEVKISAYKPIEEVLREFAKVHNKIAPIMRSRGVDDIVDKQGIEKGDRFERVMTVDVQGIDCLVAAPLSRIRSENPSI
jgi:hypothetical protein